MQSWFLVSAVVLFACNKYQTTEIYSLKIKNDDRPNFLYLDADKSLWINNSQSELIQIILPDKKIVYHIYDNQKIINVESISQIDNNTFWIVGFDSQDILRLFKWDRINNKVQKITLPKSPIKIIWDKKKEELFYIAYDHSLNIYKDGKNTSYTDKRYYQIILNNTEIVCLCDDESLNNSNEILISNTNKILWQPLVAESKGAYDLVGFYKNQPALIKFGIWEQGETKPYNSSIFIKNKDGNEHTIIQKAVKMSSINDGYLATLEFISSEYSVIRLYSIIE